MLSVCSMKCGMRKAGELRWMVELLVIATARSLRPKLIFYASDTMSIMGFLNKLC